MTEKGSEKGLKEQGGFPSLAELGVTPGWAYVPSFQEAPSEANCHMGYFDPPDVGLGSGGPLSEVWTDADCALIAAAPYMYEALREFVETHEACGSDRDPNFDISEVGGLSVYQRAVAALSKASGQFLSTPSQGGA